jgi:5-methylcytosine-specific restriction endonuclease McrBC GTP-binding regulatory subunit McrB
MAIADAAVQDRFCRGLHVATASADWTSFDTIGGYAMSQNGGFSFRSGAFLRAIEQQKWLLFDEINRGDVDRCFGELLTVLSGGHADTAFTTENGTAISIGPGEGASHRVPASFRVIATMNTWDKTSLFRLSYAVQRRFAVIHLGAPDATVYARIIHDCATNNLGTSWDALPDDAIVRMKRMFDAAGVLSFRPIGPATAIDMIRYQRSRGDQDGLAEAVVAFLLPQLVGIDRGQVGKVREALLEQLNGWSTTGAISEFQARMDELFPIE